MVSSVTRAPFLGQYSLACRIIALEHLRNKKELDLAIADLTKAIELEPNSATAHYMRGLVYKDRRKYDLAITDLQKVALLTEDPELVATVKQEIQNLGG